MIIENYTSVEPHRGQGRKCIGRNVYRLLGSDMTFIQYTESSKKQSSILDIFAKEEGSNANQTLQESSAVDECDSFALENASKAVLDAKDSSEMVSPCEKFNKQLQFLQLFFKKLLSSQGYSQPDIHTRDFNTNDCLELESSMF